jgi:hypothetical protein
MKIETFPGIDLTSEHPPGICPECAAHGIEHAPSGIVYVYCVHACRGVIRQPAEKWFAFEGVTSLRFKQHILATVSTFEIACGEAVLAAAKDSGETKH